MRRMSSGVPPCGVASNTFRNSCITSSQVAFDIAKLRLMGDSPGYDTNSTAIFNAWVLRLWRYRGNFVYDILVSHTGSTGCRLGRARGSTTAIGWE